LIIDTHGRFTVGDMKRFLDDKPDDECIAIESYHPGVALMLSFTPYIEERELSAKGRKWVVIRDCE
jgi:hypothetical protein